tara:strand:- start:449 stop:622 length:174 start_codon:yes stop_codon:yes gene_type:complete
MVDDKLVKTLRESALWLETLEQIADLTKADRRFVEAAIRRSSSLLSDLDRQLEELDG